MGCDFVIILDSNVEVEIDPMIGLRKGPLHLGDEPDWLTEVDGDPYAVESWTATFDCPNVNANERAVLMFETREVENYLSEIHINNVPVPGALKKPAFNDPDENYEGWVSNVVAIPGAANLKPVGNSFFVKSVSESTDLDDFLINNIVIMYKTYTDT